MPAVLSVFDTPGIQRYVFGSNRLRENVVASYLVHRATADWLDEASAPFAQTARLLYRGGGKAILLCDDPITARAITRTLSMSLLLRAPGLRLDVAHTEYDPSTNALGGPNGVYARALQSLGDHSRHRPPSLSLAGLGVTRVCRSTGQPAVADDPEEPGRPVSAEVSAKVSASTRRAADERLRQVLGDGSPALALLDRYALSRDLDDLGRARGESSYIAVVHADGNAIGTRFAALANRFPNPAQNEACAEALARLSNAVETAGRTALQAMTAELLVALETPAFADFCRSLARDKRDGRPILPLRPLVFGGDDVTFVCDGRLGLTLAVAYLRAFDRAAAQLPDGDPDGKAAHASAGVAIVKTHYPFARAYDLADELCRSAKRLVRDPGLDAAAIDWQFATTGIAAELDVIRQRFYNAPDGALAHRPLLLEGEGWGSWRGLTAGLQAFAAPRWQERRNKLIALREALRAGGAATSQFMTAYGLAELPEIPGIPGESYRHSGWHERVCAYFDAIEALDFYLDLDPAAQEVVA